MEEITRKLSFTEYYKQSLAGNPQPLPGAKEPNCIWHEQLDINPEYSVVMPIYNQEAIIAKHLTAIRMHTTGTYELILIVDACSDQTERVVRDWVQQCTLSPTGCCGITVVKSETPLFETAADNIGFLLSRAPYCLEIQADMEMVQPGYNGALRRPFQERDDVIGVSGRCCHDFRCRQVTGKGGRKVEQPLDGTLSPDVLYVNETCNRGPLMLDRAKLAELRYLDEQNFFLDNSDHDLFARAWAQRNWICGHVPIEFSTRLEEGSTRKPRDPLNAQFLQLRRARSRGGFLPFYMQKYTPREPFTVNLKALSKQT